MATVSQSPGRGAYDFAHKIYNCYLLKSQNKQGISAVQNSYLSAAFLFGDIKNGGLYGADRAADKVIVGVSRDSYTRATPPCRTSTDVGSECYYSVGLNKEHSLPNKTQDRSIEKIPRYRGFINFRRTFCTSRFARRLQNLERERLCWGHGQSVFIRAYTGNGTRTEPLYKTKTGYYEILEVTPTATQGQIKTAYYKQSFVYHPDRNAGSEVATVRFSEINEAYTVLGNKALRKKYDRGLLAQSDLVAPARPSGKDTTGGSAKRQDESRRSVMGADRRGGVFDFDNFFKAHYNEQLQRQQDIRSRKEEMLKKERETIEEMKLERLMEIGLGLMLAMLVAILISLKQK